MPTYTKRTNQMTPRRKSSRYVLSSTLWCPLRFRIKTMFGLSFPPAVCRRAYVLFTFSVVQHILRCVFGLFVFVMCALCCQFLWIVHFWLPLQYSLSFI